MPRGRKSNAPQRKTPETQSNRAGIDFPVGRMGRYMRTGTELRVGAQAPVMMAAIMEYMCAEILELASVVCKDHKKKRIVPRHIELAVRNDIDMSRLYQNKTFFGAGMTPHIDSRLIPQKKPKRQRRKQTQKSQGV